MANKKNDGNAPKALAKVNRTLDQAVEKMTSELAANIDPERFAKVALTNISSNPRLIQACVESPWSLVVALREAGQLGLEPTGVMGHAYLVPYRNTKRDGALEVQFQPGWRGLVELALRSGEYAHIESDVVREGDRFDYAKGLSPTLEHVPLLDDDGRGDLEHAWALARPRDPDVVPPFHVMGQGEIHRVRNHSQAYRSGSGPWITDESEMWRKTVIKNLCKHLRMTPELERAMTIDDAVEAGDTETLRAIYQGAVPADVIAEEDDKPKSRSAQVAEKLTAGGNGEGAAQGPEKPAREAPEDEEGEGSDGEEMDRVTYLQALMTDAASDADLMSFEESEEWELAAHDGNMEAVEEAIAILEERLGVDPQSDLGF